MTRSRVPLVAAVSVGAAVAFALVARAVARRDTAPVDHQVHEKTAVDPEHPLRRAAEKAAPVGKWWTYGPAAVLAGACVFGARAREEGHSHIVGTGSIVATAGLACALAKAFDDLLPQPPAPPGRSRPDHPVFPSGHAMGTTAVALAAAYVLTREELAPAHLAFPIALAIPLASSAGRLVEEKHWISDITGGFLAAIAVAAFTAVPYEISRAGE